MNTWKIFIQNHQAHIARQLQIRRFLAKMQHSRLYQRFITWVNYSHNQRVMRQRFQQAARRWQNKTLYKSLHQWINHTSEIKRMKYVSNKIVAKWRYRQLSVMLLRWNEFVDEIWYARAVMRRFVHRIANLLLVLGWNLLNMHTQRSRNIEHHMQRALQRWQTKSVTRVYNRWYDFTKESIRIWVSSRRVIKKITLRTLASAISGEGA